MVLFRVKKHTHAHRDTERGAAVIHWVTPWITMKVRLQPGVRNLVQNCHGSDRDSYSGHRLLPPRVHRSRKLGTGSETQCSPLGAPTCDLSIRARAWPAWLLKICINIK